MKEKEVWTLDGRKKVYLVNECNQVIKEVKDLGPLNETEKLWVKLQPGVPYKDWYKDYKRQQKSKKQKKI